MSHATPGVTTMAPPQLSVEELTGVWDLVHYITRHADGRESAPLGEAAVGRICYTADGFMFGFMARAGREPFASADRLRATEAEKAAAFDDCVCYAGRWSLRDDGCIVHHVQMSLLPNWTGDDQVRVPTRDGPFLDLSASIGDGASRRVAVVRWRRASWTDAGPQGAMSTSPITASS